VLGVEQVGVLDNFFELGGHSLKAVKLSSLIQDEFGVHIALKDIFADPVLCDMAVAIANSSGVVLEGIPGVSDSASGYVLSSSQRRLWVLSQFSGVGTAYHVPGTFVLEGDVCVSALGRSFARVLRRHEILRTVFRDSADGVRQHVLGADEVGFVLGEEDLRGEGGGESEALLRASALQGEAFDLSAGPLLRGRLYRVGESRWIFGFVMHHIISDGWSMGILVRELLAYYRSEQDGTEADLVDLRIQYRDYASWQQSSLGAS
ncbi:condensation domain-containing protein, partial [Sphingobacterium siyangense]